MRGKLNLVSILTACGLLIVRTPAHGRQGFEWGGLESADNGPKIVYGADETDNILYTLTCQPHQSLTLFVLDGPWVPKSDPPFTSTIDIKVEGPSHQTSLGLEVTGEWSEHVGRILKADLKSPNDFLYALHQGKRFKVKTDYSSTNVPTPPHGLIRQFAERCGFDYTGK